MANEIRGKLYEVITRKALEKAVTLAGIRGNICWNETPEGMSVEPDFIIGINKDNPNFVIMVTASGSSRNAEMKSWRNLGELQEIKAQLQDMPRVINLYFISEVKKELAEGTNRLYDATLHIQDRPYSKELDRWVKANSKIIARSKEEKIAFLEQGLAENPALEDALFLLADDLAEALKQENKALRPLWTLMRADYLKPRKIPTARKTSVRRGLGKLLILEPELRKLVYNFYERNEPIDPEIVPRYAFDLKLLGPSIAGAVPTDSETASVVELLGPALCEQTLASVPDSMRAWIDPLRELHTVMDQVDFVRDNPLLFSDPLEYKRLIGRCFDAPETILAGTEHNGLWVLKIAVSLNKALSGKTQGYGLSHISVDTQIPERGKGENLLRFFFPKLLQRQQLPDDPTLEKLASGLSKRFVINFGEDFLTKIEKARSKVVEFVIKENLEDRLLPYRNFEPLLWLLEAELKNQGKDYDAKKSCTGWINDFSGIGKRAATTPFVRAGDCLVHWKTVSDAGKVHKKKELAARARNIRYQYDNTNKTFLRRPELSQLVLIIDGTFDGKDLKILSESGWDTIIYPDEIPSFVSSLK